MSRDDNSKQNIANESSNQQNQIPYRWVLGYYKVIISSMNIETKTRVQMHLDAL
jgi:hypothetical protein